MAHQRLFSLHVTCDDPIPFAPLIPSAGTPDVRIRVERVQPVPCHSFEPWPASAEAQYQRVERSGDRWRLRYLDGTTIDIEPHSVAIDWQSPLTFEDACTYLVGAPFALLLRMRSVACLHGSAVTWNGRTIAFIGPSGAGKSTIAASLIDRGASLVTDDLLAITVREGVPQALPSYSGVRLWPASVEILRGNAGMLPRITQGWDKRILESDASAEPRSLDVIVLLAPPPVDALAPATMLMHLIANSYRPDLLTADWRREEFEILSSIVGRTKVQWIPPHIAPDALAASLENSGV